jgi:DNA replication protein DnaC
MTPEMRERENARVQADADRYNERPGALNVDHVDANGNMVRGDGIDCPECLNKGSVYVVLTGEDGVARMFFKQCGCLKRRLAVRRIQESGMERAVKRFTFEAFTVESDWQRQMKETALRYLQEGVKDGAWLYIGGQSGCGKTMVCTATVGVILRKRAVRYMAWPHEAQKIKASANDDEKYGELVRPLQEAEALYIDDFLKPLRGKDGSDGNATAADLRLAFDVLNMRYINRKPTIISSEWFSHEIGALDEAIAGRISEMCGPWKIDIARDGKRNLRMRENVI